MKKQKRKRKTISLLAEIESGIKAQQSAGLERWNQIEYLKADMMNFVMEHGLDDYREWS